jgi:hypothetical protein
MSLQSRELISLMFGARILKYLHNLKGFREQLKLKQNITETHRDVEKINHESCGWISILPHVAVEEVFPGMIRNGCRNNLSTSVKR